MKNILKLGMIVLVLGMIVSCAAPPKVVNDPTIPDNGVIILNIGSDPYNQYPNCYPPFQMGSYCDPYRARVNPYPATQFYLPNNRKNP